MRRRKLLLDTIEPLARIGHYEWNYDLDRLESCSEEYARIYKMTISEIKAVQSSWDKIIEQIHPEDREYYEQSILPLDDERSFDVQYRFIRNDGELRYLRELGVLVPDGESGNMLNFGIVHDITEQVNFQHRLEDRDELWQQAESIIDIGHFNYDLASETYIYISPGFANIHGVGVEAYLDKVSSRGDDMVDVHAQDYDRLEAVYREHAEQGKDINVEYRILRADGETRWIREQATVIRSANGLPGHSVGVLQDISETREIEQSLREARDTLEATVEARTVELAETITRLEEEISEREKVSAELNFMANHDALTGLPSLRLCKDRLDRSLAEARRNQQKSAVMFLDLDGFKEINDSYGHEFGDLVLKVTADRIKAEIRETDTVARIGGDEFIIILSRLPELPVVEKIATSLIRQIAQVIHIVQHQVSVSASIGIALYPEHGSMSEDLIRSADRAMYQVKNTGKNGFMFYQPDEA